MNNQMRFGRRLPLPSTAEIKHELRLMAAADDIRASLAEDSDLSPGSRVDGIVGDLARTHNLTPARARMLVDRFALAVEPDGKAHADGLA